MNELQSLIEIGRRNWWIVVLTAGIGLLGSIAVSTMTEPTYQTSARFIVSPNILEEDRDVINSLEALDKRSVVVTYAEVLRSNRIFDAARKELGIAAADLVDYGLTAVVLPEANVLELTITGPDPERAASLANHVGEQAIEYMSSLYPVHRFDFLDMAPAPLRPFAPQPIQNAILAVALGLGFGGLLVILRERLLPAMNSQESHETQSVGNLEENPPDNQQSTTTNGDSNDIEVTTLVTK